jgi:hypothetical protein
VTEASVIEQFSSSVHALDKAVAAAGGWEHEGGLRGPGPRHGRLFMATAPDNEQRLRKKEIVREGVVLPEAYRAVVEGLTPDELEVILAVKRRLEEAERTSGTPIVDVMIAP